MLLHLRCHNSREVIRSNSTEAVDVEVKVEITTEEVEVDTMANRPETMTDNNNNKTEVATRTEDEEATITSEVIEVASTSHKVSRCKCNNSNHLSQINRELPLKRSLSHSSSCQGSTCLSWSSSIDSAQTTG